MSHHGIFDSLTRNAFDFSERGIAEFDKSPKYSVIHFCADCFDIPGGIEQCRWCCEYNTGDMEHSYSVGCSHCAGKLGWEKDD